MNKSFDHAFEALSHPSFATANAEMMKAHEAYREARSLTRLQAQALRSRVS